MHGQKRQTAPPAQIERWELELVGKVASAFRTSEPEELEAELSKKLLELKPRLPGGIHNWRAYLAKFLYNKAANLVRDWRAREKRNRGEPDELGAVPSSSGQSDLALAFRPLWDELDPELRPFWTVLVEEGGNQVAVARRLGLHRNTVRLRIQKIRRLLEKHGFR